jgi:hypothetical protein
VDRHLYILVPFFPAPKNPPLTNLTDGPLADASKSLDEQEHYFQQKITRFSRWMSRHRASLEFGFGAKIHELRLEPNSTFGLAGGASITYAFPEIPLLQTKGQEIVGIPKGLAIRLALMVVLNDVDMRGVEHRKNAFVIQIDGSGAFNYDGIYRIAKRLIMDDKDIVFGLRPGNWLMPQPDRKKIEQFENAILVNAVKNAEGCELDLIDGQAGCWGLRVSELRRLSLSALDYELEFDLLSSALMSGYELVYSEELLGDQRIGPTAPTVLDFTDPRKTLGKLPFILYKLGWTKRQLSEFVQCYERRYANDPTRCLPEPYIQQLKIWACE